MAIHRLLTRFAINFPGFNSISLLVLYVQGGTRGNSVNRGQAITLLTDLCLKEKMVQPNFVVIEQRGPGPDAYQLKIKGYDDSESVKKFVQNKNFSVEEDKDKNYLLIF